MSTSSPHYSEEYPRDSCIVDEQLCCRLKRQVEAKISSMQRPVEESICKPQLFQIFPPSKFHYLVKKTQKTKNQPNVDTDLFFNLNHSSWIRIRDGIWSLDLTSPQSEWFHKIVSLTSGLERCSPSPPCGSSTAHPYCLCSSPPASSLAIDCVCGVGGNYSGIMDRPTLEIPGHLCSDLHTILGRCGWLNRRKLNMTIWGAFRKLRSQWRLSRY